MASRRDLGAVTSYAYAIEHGFFSGTESEWVAMLRDISPNALAAEAAAEQAARYRALSESDAQSAGTDAALAALAATRAASNAATATQEANRAEAAAENKGYMDFAVNDSGHLIYTCTVLTTNIDFEIVNGNLHVLYS